MPIFSNFYLYSFSCLNSIGFDFDTFLILAAIEAKIIGPHTDLQIADEQAPWIPSVATELSSSKLKNNFYNHE